MIDLPMLFKKTSTGAIQYWEIWVEGSSIITRYGQVGTNNPQTTTDTITKGKNAGRANATTSSQQAELEAEADSTFDAFVTSADAGRKFEPVMDRIESQLEAAKKLEAVERDLELNEAVVIVDNVESDIAVAEKLATGAALAEISGRRYDPG